MTARPRLTAGVLLAAAVFAMAMPLRTAWLTADPPTRAAVGIVWHDEGAWVHNARNRALWGEWRTDEWNPMYVAPVFTALEFTAFRVFGVGTWQARVVPVASGLLAIAALMIGLHALAGRRAALLGGALLAANYVFTMWNRAALLESTMTAFIVAGWAAWAAADRRPAWGAAAGLAAVLAWFSKAAAAFFVAALVLDALVAIRLARPEPRARRAAAWALGGLAAGAAIAAAVFVLPNWSEYRFYNWQMSVARKPSYAPGAIADRASWLPIVHAYFTWLWPLFVAALVALLGIVSRWRTARPGERLLVLWVLVGLAELAVHDSGNERRYVMFIPAIVALGSLAVTSAAPLASATIAAAGPLVRAFAAPLLLALAYLAWGSLLRPWFLGDILAGDFKSVVRWSAVLAAVTTAGVLATWSRSAGALARRPLPSWLGAAAVMAVVAGDAWHHAGWMRHRTELNHRASVEVGRLLPPGTPVQGKLANGLALENRIRPLFIGRGFGNYADRHRREDVRYILTYVAPRLGYESPEGLMQDVLTPYPHRRIVATFDVDETPGGDRAALIDKRPDARDD